MTFFQIGEKYPPLSTRFVDRSCQNQSSLKHDNERRSTGNEFIFLSREGKGKFGINRFAAQPCLRLVLPIIAVGCGFPWKVS